MHIDELLIKIWETGIEITSDRLRIALSDREEFIYFGYSETFGLKLWEKKGEIKGGSVRQIVYQYLNRFDNPTNFLQIFNYVKKYRRITIKSIRSNIKLEVEKQHRLFEIYNNDLVGIKGRKYNKTQ